MTGESTRGPACVPRTFGTGTLFAVSSAFAGMYGLQRLFHVSVETSLYWTLLLAAVAVGQMIVGAKPRLVSVVIGCVFSPLWQFFSVTSNLPLGASLLGGALSGYVAGVFASGLFLVMERTARWFGRTKEVGR